MDYGHGTGHGVGYFMNVHEGPQSISLKNTVVLREGMIVSDGTYIPFKILEPGFYKQGEFGIRIEDLLMVVDVGDDCLGF